MACQPGLHFFRQQLLQPWLPPSLSPDPPCPQAPDITAELFVEVLGCLANLYIPEFDFLGLVRKHDLLTFLATYAQPGAVDDDILLEVVMFVGVLCNEGTAPLIVSSGLVGAQAGARRGCAATPCPRLACVR